MTSSGVQFREQMAGWVGVPRSDGVDTEQAWLRMRAAVIIKDLDEFVGDPRHRGALVGHIDFSPLGQNIPASGHVELFAAGSTAGTRVMRYQCTFEVAGFGYEMIGTKYVNKASGYNIWGQTTTLFTTVMRKTPDARIPLAAGVIRLSMSGGMRMLLTLRGTGPEALPNRAAAVLRFMGFFVEKVAGSFLPVRSAP